MKVTILAFTLLLLTAFPLTAQGQEGIAELKNFRYGKLDNGLSYFIKGLEKPQKKTSLRFYIKVGGTQEDNNQLQIAHLLEHVAFKPSDNFPRGIKDEILKVNMIARDVGGTTGHKFTRYSFDAPSENKKAFRMGLNWFKEISMKLKLTDEDIDKERGAVRQEFLYGDLGNLKKKYAKKNLNAKLFPCYSSFDSFLDHIKTFPSDNLRRFYKDWYRPDLMGIVIVGNIKDMDTAEQLIKSIFGDVPRHNNPRNKTNCDSLYFARPPQFAVQALKIDSISEDVPQIEYKLFFRQPELARNIGTKQGYKQYIAFKLFLEILKERFHQMQLTAEPEPSLPIIVLNAYKHAFPLSFMLSFKSPEPESRKNFQNVMATLNQLRSYGVLEKEWKTTKGNDMEIDFIEDEGYWHRQLLDYFVNGEVLFKNKKEILQQWVQDLSVEDFNKLILQFLPPMPEDIGIIAPSGNAALHYTEEQVRTWIKQSNQQSVNPYQLPENIRVILTPKEVSQLKKRGYIDRGWKKNGTKEILLDNGIKVVLKPYPPTKGIGDEQIGLRGFSKIGAACFPKEDYYSALNAPSIIEYSGVGQFSMAQIRSFRATANIASCTPYIDYKESGIHGQASLTNMEDLFQLVYLYFTKPKYDLQKFKNWKRVKRETYFSNGRNFTEDFRNNIRHFYHDNILPPTFGYRYLKSTEAYNSIEKTNGLRGFEIYRQIFGQPQNFTFILTGNFELDKVMPLIQKYFGNIPQVLNTPTCKNKKTTPLLIKGPFYKEFISESTMESVKYDLSYVKKTGKNDWKETIKIQVLGELTDQILKRLRYQNGFDLYNFGAAGRYNPDLSRHTINFDITCQADQLKPIQQECRKIIEEIKRGEIKEEYFQQAIKRIRGHYAKQTLLQHRNMKKLLYEQLRYDLPWVVLDQYDKYLQSLSTKDMIKMAKKYFKKENQYEFVMSDTATSY